MFLLDMVTVAPTTQDTPSDSMITSGPRNISSPYNTRHITHVGFDPNTGEFTGLPREWHILLKSSGITQSEQEQNPEVSNRRSLFFKGNLFLSM